MNVDKIIEKIVDLVKTNPEMFGLTKKNDSSLWCEQPKQYLMYKGEDIEVTAHIQYKFRKHDKDLKKKLNELEDIIKKPEIAYGHLLKTFAADSPQKSLKESNEILIKAEEKGEWLPQLILDIKTKAIVALDSINVEVNLND